jgi:hypothetical protein
MRRANQISNTVVAAAIKPLTAKMTIDVVSTERFGLEDAPIRAGKLTVLHALAFDLGQGPSSASVGIKAQAKHFSVVS